MVIPQSGWEGGGIFWSGVYCLSCMNVGNSYLRHNFWAVRNRDLVTLTVTSVVVNFPYFRLLLSLQSYHPGLWLAETFSTSSLQPLNRIWQNLTGSKISTSYTTFVFLGRSEIQYGRPGVWLTENFTFSATSERISTKFVGKEHLSILYQVCVFRTDRGN